MGEAHTSALRKVWRGEAAGSRVVSDSGSESKPGVRVTGWFWWEGWDSDRV